jgi:ADP-heptose:LPS heptosyltransferase
VSPDKRILLVRLSAIGDIVFASPLAGDLRRAFPKSFIALDCSPCKRNPIRGEAFTCMRSIEVDEVLGAAQELVGRGS